MADQDQLHNHNNNRAIGQPPPKKKRKRLFTEYSDFTAIIEKLSNKYDPRLFACIKYVANMGLKCTTCKRDSNLKGTWTKIYCKNFNYNKIKTHVIDSDVHWRRLNDEEKKLHPKFIALNKSQNDISINTNLPSQLDKIIKAIDLVHLIIKTGCSLNKISPFSDFIGDEMIQTQLKSHYHTDEIIKAMNVHQTKLDHTDIFGPDRTNIFSMSFDGSSRKTRAVKIFDIKGCKIGHGPITKYGVCVDAKKSLADIDVDLTSLMTTDTGDDNRKLVVKVVNEHFGITDWEQLVQLCVDGAGQNMGCNKGCVAQVCCTFSSQLSFHCVPSISLHNYIVISCVLLSAFSHK